MAPTNGPAPTQSRHSARCSRRRLRGRISCASGTGLITMFDYLAVLISVVLGLAVTHVLTGISAAINRRDRAPLDWLQIFWAVDVLAYVLAVWWGMYWWKHLTTWTVQEFAFLTSYAIVLFLMASALFPGEVGHGADQPSSFERNRLWFFSLLLAAHLIDIPETAAKQVNGLRAVPPQYWFAGPAFILIAVTGLLSSRRRVHAVLAPAWLAVLVGYEVFSALDQIVAS